jgi:chorismate mutase
MEEIKKLRGELDEIDTAIIGLIAKRFKVTQKIGHLKRQNNLPAQDLAREAEILKKIGEKALSLDLKPELIQSIYKLIMAEVVANHKELWKQQSA